MLTLDGEPTPLTAGDIMVFYLDDHTVSFMRGEHKLYFKTASGKDDKRIMNLVNSEHEAMELAIFIGNIHDFATSIRESDNPALRFYEFRAWPPKE